MDEQLPGDLRATASQLAADLELAHSDKTRAGKPRKLWLRYAHKDYEKLRAALEGAEQEIALLDAQVEEKKEEKQS